MDSVKKLKFYKLTTYLKGEPVDEDLNTDYGLLTEVEDLLYVPKLTECFEVDAVKQALIDADVAQNRQVAILYRE